MLRIISARVAAADGSAVAVRVANGDEYVMITGASPEGDWRELEAWRRAGGAIAPHEPANVITGARFANQDGSAIIIVTEDCGDVLISERDRADLWAACMAWRDAGGVIADYIAPNVEPRADLAEDLAVLKRVMIDKGIASEAEIDAAMSARSRGADARP